MLLDKTPIDEIHNIYQDVSEWLKFAEAKHAGLLAMWIALFSAAYSEKELFTHASHYYITLLALLFGSFINLFSFSPFLNRQKIIRKLCYNAYKNNSGNQVFYQSVFIDTYCSDSYSVNQSLNAYKHIFLQNFNSPYDCPLLDNYITQVIEVSTVCTIKLYLFQISIKYTIFIFILGAMEIIIA